MAISNTNEKNINKATLQERHFYAIMMSFAAAKNDENLLELAFDRFLYFLVQI